MSLRLPDIPTQVDDFDPANDSVIVTDKSTFNGSGTRPVSAIFRGDVVSITGSSLTLSSAHNGKILWGTYTGSAITVTYPAGGIFQGFNTTVVQGTTGQVTVAGTTGSSVVNFDSQYKTAGLYAAIGVVVGPSVTVALVGGRTGA